MRRHTIPDPIIPLRPEHAVEVASWRYEGEYAIYNWPPDATGLPDGSSYVMLNSAGQLIGFYQFGAEARIPTVEEDAYPPGYMDIGLGLRPDLCGLGFGEGFVLAGMRFARENLGAECLRLTVAAFNERAQKVYRRCGFEECGRVTHRTSGAGFVIMCRELCG